MLTDFAEEKFDILIQAGQSNAQGTAFGDVPHPYIPDPRVLYLQEDMTVTLAREAVEGNAVRGNLGLTFASDYLAAGLLDPGRKLLILRAAVGGTGFMEGHWTPDGAQYQKMLEMARTALAMNPENQLVALLWHQGERDCWQESTYAHHYDHLKTLVDNVRAEFVSPALPFVAGDLVQDWKQAHLSIATPVTEAIRAVCTDCGGAFVSSEGLPSNRESQVRHPFGNDDDRIHFSRPAVYELGHRYFEAYQYLTHK